MRGLSNLGQTCWANAALQCLAHCPHLSRLLMMDVVFGTIVHEPARKLGAFVRSYWRGSGVLPRQILRDAAGVLSNAGEAGMPQDAHEAFVRALSTLDDALRQRLVLTPRPGLDEVAWASQHRRSYSVLADMFALQVRQSVDSSVSWDHPWQLAVPPRTPTSQAIRAQLRSSERVDDRVVQREITAVPVCLAVSGSDMRVDGVVDLDAHGTYEAVAAAALVGGHWVAAVHENGAWYLCDDDTVTQFGADNLPELLGVQLALYRRVL